MGRGNRGSQGRERGKEKVESGFRWKRVARIIQAMPGNREVYYLLSIFHYPLFPARPVTENAVQVTRNPH